MAHQVFFTIAVLFVLCPVGLSIDNGESAPPIPTSPSSLPSLSLSLSLCTQVLVSFRIVLVHLILLIHLLPVSRSDSSDGLEHLVHSGKVSYLVSPCCLLLSVTHHSFAGVGETTAPARRS